MISPRIENDAAATPLCEATELPTGDSDPSLYEDHDGNTALLMVDSSDAASAWQ